MSTTSKQQHEEENKNNNSNSNNNHDDDNEDDDDESNSATRAQLSFTTVHRPPWQLAPPIRYPIILVELSKYYLCDQTFAVCDFNSFVAFYN
ncbi:Hypothetical predicted protein [Octopus vulgaris]|uniref:Uncharacterized protein n=1 Tax=Octopus vulgaris TaxID=6645 RepID=A0AA36B2B2_OCTVU|nr:Hypothetical predicted protein [Octopus vulgaris]